MNINKMDELKAPIFYPSVSSVAKNPLSVENHIDLLLKYNYKQFLVSCYDVFNLKQNYIDGISCIIAEQENLILLDSGIYEMFWGKQNWKVDEYYSILEKFPYYLSFSFDDYYLKGNFNIESIKESIDLSTKNGLFNNICPIIHCPNDPDFFEEIIPKISKEITPKLIAIPERELGKGLFEIAQNIKKIKSKLIELGIDQSIHILGTGNPISLMIYYFAGAQSFDGLDWCQTVVDYKNADLHHYQHLDLYSYQSKGGKNTDLPFLARCFIHNLEFYNIFTDELRNLSDDKMKFEFLSERMKNKEVYSKIKSILWN